MGRLAVLFEQYDCTCNKKSKGPVSLTWSSQFHWVFWGFLFSFIFRSKSYKLS